MNRAIVNQHNKTTHMQKTAIQHILDNINLGLKHHEDPALHKFMSPIVDMLNMGAIDERYQIEKAYMDGADQTHESAHDYFTSKYGKDGTE